MDEGKPDHTHTQPPLAQAQAGHRELYLKESPSNCNSPFSGLAGSTESIKLKVELNRVHCGYGLMGV